MTPAAATVPVEAVNAPAVSPVSEAFLPAQRVPAATCPEPVRSSVHRDNLSVQFCGLPRGALTIRIRRPPPQRCVPPQCRLGHSWVEGSALNDCRLTVNYVAPMTGRACSRRLPIRPPTPQTSPRGRSRIDHHQRSACACGQMLPAVLRQRQLTCPARIATLRVTTERQARWRLQLGQQSPTKTATLTTATMHPECRSSALT